MAFQKPSHTFTKIHRKALRTHYKNLLFALSFTSVINISSYAQDLPVRVNSIRSKTETDTVRVKTDTILKVPTIGETVKDSISQDSIPKKKEFLSDIVSYSAKDYVSMNQRLQKIRLYDEAVIEYTDMNIKAGVIEIDYTKNLVYAGRLKDSAGTYTQNPIFTQGENVVEPDSIIFNTESKKALVFNSRTKQSEFNVIAPRTKKENDSVYFLEKGRFTTSENLDDPEYEFIASKIKLVPNKKIVVGATNMEIYGVPTPVWLPFAYFPLTDSRSSGILLPSFGEDNDAGYNLQDLGYYFAFSEYVDLALYTDIFTNGSYGFRAQSSYALRYKFRGNVSFQYEKQITSERGFPDYSQRSFYNIRWSHNQDTKASPNSRFNASVNLGSSRYYQNSIRQQNLSNTQNNTLSSSISYSKTYPIEPAIQYSITATHQQNTNTQVINMTLPTFQGSVDRIFPFAPSTGSKKGIIQNINFNYQVRAENRIQTTDSLFFTEGMFDEARIGAQHTIPLTTNFKLFKYLSLSAGTSFSENWTYNTINRFYDADLRQVVTEDVTGFESYRTYNFNTSLGTTIYGRFPFTKEGKDPLIQEIRHVIRPALSYNINPAFDQYYDNVEIINADGLTNVELNQTQFSRFEGSLFGSPNQRFSSSLGLSVGNNIEAKIRSKDSTSLEPKKISILNSLNFSTSYNFAADTLKLSPIRVSGGTNILNNKMAINFGASLDPYALDSNNRRVDKLNVDNGGSFFRLTSANFNVSYSLSSDTFKAEKDTEEEEEATEESIRSGGRADDLFGKPMTLRERAKSNLEDSKTDSEFYKFEIPWSLRLAYALNYSNNIRQNTVSSHSLMFSGNVELTPNWSVSGNSGYDIQNNGFTFTQMTFTRKLLTWNMNFSWVPFGRYSQWNFFIGISSNLLKDLKYEKRKQRDRQL
ncbi:LPS assembly outer membrane protein LptD (organic solvent tolerance protein OstA) [Flavobacteriaceae bacterium MAR_2010_188]|nr:LPS assembly outer membrane protein LptD (organic solvent tolerance protein OstA) [Flavobacteriaceae bacterium MAR_2010_188]